MPEMSTTSHRNFFNAFFFFVNTVTLPMNCKFAFIQRVIQCMCMHALCSQLRDPFITVKQIEWENVSRPVFHNVRVNEESPRKVDTSEASRQRITFPDHNNECARPLSVMSAFRSPLAVCVSYDASSSYTQELGFRDGASCSSVCAFNDNL